MAANAQGAGERETGAGLGEIVASDMGVGGASAAGDPASGESAAPRPRQGHVRPEIALIYPIFDTRGEEAERIVSWTRDQTLARDRFRILVVVDGEERRGDVLPYLAAHDEVVVAPGTNDVGMWNAGAGRANTPWIVMTEGHCIADPDCLKNVAAWIAGEPNAAAGNFRVGHPRGYRMAELSERWFGEMHERWESPSEWSRLHRAGCVLRAEAFEAVGGFAPYAGQFAYPLLSARLSEAGHAISEVPGASVVHMDSYSIRGHHIDTIDHVVGECEARTRHDPAFFEQYFGHDPIFANGLAERRDVAAQLLRAVISAMIARPGSAGRFARLLPSLLKPAIMGAGLRTKLGKLVVLMDEMLVDRFPLPSGLIWRRYLRAHARLVDITRHEWAARRTSPAGPVPDWQRLEPEKATSQTIAGVHAMEIWRSRPFRWSHPVFMLRVVPRAEPRVLTIDTGEIRGDPVECIASTIVDGRPIARGSLSSDGHGRLRIPLHAGAGNVVLAIDPVAPTPGPGGDPRWLGISIFGCELEDDSARAPSE